MRRRINTRAKKKQEKKLKLLSFCCFICLGLALGLGLGLGLGRFAGGLTTHVSRARTSCLKAGYGYQIYNVIRLSLRSSGRILWIPSCHRSFILSIFS